MAVSSWALLTRADGKDHLQLDSDEFDLVIDGLIDSATLLCEAYTKRLLLSRSFVEVYDGMGDAELPLRHYPVTAVSSVEFLTDVSTWTSYSTTDFGLYIREPSLDAIGWRSLSFPWGQQCVRVTYTAGFSAATEAMKSACRIALKALWDVRDKQNAGIASQSFPGGQVVTYDPAALPRMFGVLLDPYRDWRLN